MLVPAGIALSFSAEFDDPTPANVGMSIYDDTGLVPVLFGGPFAMTRVISNIYRGKFTALGNHSYIVVMAVYTDNTLQAFDTEFTEVTVSVNAQYLSPPVQSVIGVVNCNESQS